MKDNIYNLVGRQGWLARIGRRSHSARVLGCAIALMSALVMSSPAQAAESIDGGLFVQAHCDRTSWLGADRIWVVWREITKDNAVIFDTGKTLNDHGGGRAQDWSAAVPDTRFSLGPGESRLYVVSLVVHSDWIVPDVMKVLGQAADVVFPAYTGGNATAFAEALANLISGNEAVVASIIARYVNANGKIACYLEPMGPTADLGIDKGGVHAYQFDKGRAEYFFGVKNGLPPDPIVFDKLRRMRRDGNGIPRLLLDQ